MTVAGFEDSVMGRGDSREVTGKAANRVSGDVPAAPGDAVGTVSHRALPVSPGNVPPSMADTRTPLEVLIDAKLSGTSKLIGDEWGYQFRTNEQAANLAIEALVDAGWELRRLNTAPGTTERAL